VKSHLEELLILLLVGLFGFFLYSLIPYYKSEKKEPLIELFIIILSSGVLTLILTTFFFNLLIFLTYITKIPITITLTIIISSVSVIFLFYIFFLTITKLSKHFMGYFDHESFFVFKHWPFKIFNINWKRKWTLLKYPLIVIVIGLIITSFVFYSFLYRTNESIEEKAVQARILFGLELSESCFDRLVEYQNFSITEKTAILIFKKGTDYLYNKDSFLDIDLIYHGCDFRELVCQQKSFDPSKKIEEQVVLEEGQNTIRKIKTEDKIVIFIPKNYPYEQLLSCSLPFNKEQLKLKIVQKVEEERKNLFSEIFERKVPKTTWPNSFDLIVENVLYYVELGLELSFQRNSWKAIDYEWKFIQNETIDLTEHSNKLNENIKILYPKFLAIKPTSDTFGLDFSSQEPTKYSFTHIISFDKSMGYLIGRITHFEKFEQELNKLRENYLKEKIQELYRTKDIEESLESKAIRLKIIETLLAKQIIRNNPEQKEEIVEITQSPSLYR